MASGLRSAPELEGVSCQLAVALRGADARPTNLQHEGRGGRGRRVRFGHRMGIAWALHGPIVRWLKRPNALNARQTEGTRHVASAWQQDPQAAPVGPPGVARSPWRRAVLEGRCP